MCRKAWRLDRLPFGSAGPASKDTGSLSQIHLDTLPHVLEAGTDSSNVKCKSSETRRKLGQDWSRCQRRWLYLYL